MPNPYESAFGEEEQTPKKPEDAEQKNTDFSSLPPWEEGDLTPALDTLIERCAAFSEKALQFGQLLTRLRVVDHQVSLAVKQAWLHYLVKVDDPHEQASLAGERKYYRLLQDKFVAIIEPMKALAQEHRQSLQEFHFEIDEHYYDPNRTDLELKRDIEQVKSDLILQRKILHEAQQALEILAEALETTERRLANYINAGGIDNLASSELALLKKARQQLTEGQQHTFNYRFFALNLLDKASLSFGLLPKRTTTQYLNNLSLALEAKS